MALGHGDVRGCGVERGPDHLAIRQERGQLGIGECLGRESREEPRHRCPAAVEPEAEAELTDQIPGELPVLRGLRMLDRLDHETVLGEPLGRGVVQLWDGIGLCAPELQAKEIREQLVVAEPRSLRVEREDECIRVLELEQDSLRSGGPDDAIGERPVHLLEDGRSQQEPTHGLRLALHHFGDQIVRHRALAARELGDEALRVGTPGQRECRQS